MKEEIKAAAQCSERHREACFMLLEALHHMHMQFSQFLLKSSAGFIYISLHLFIGVAQKRIETVMFKI